jgi:hypothetical protein
MQYLAKSLIICSQIYDAANDDSFAIAIYANVTEDCPQDWLDEYYTSGIEVEFTLIHDEDLIPIFPSAEDEERLRNEVLEQYHIIRTAEKERLEDAIDNHFENQKEEMYF